MSLFPYKNEDVDGGHSYFNQFQGWVVTCASPNVLLRLHEANGLVTRNALFPNLHFVSNTVRNNIKVKI